MKKTIKICLLGILIAFFGCKDSINESNSAINNSGNRDNPTFIATNTCIGEDGEILLVNPPAVTNGSYITPSLSDCGSWDFELHLESLQDDDGNGGQITYEVLSACSNVELDIPPTSG